jgi:hypothetical protein
MNTIARHWRTYSLVVVTTAAIFTGCADDRVVGLSGNTAPLAALASAEIDDAAEPGSAARTVDLGTCDNLGAPSGSRLALRVYASGVQVYEWDGARWGFIAPVAELFANADGSGIIGTHFHGPTWKSTSGSWVIGEVVERCTPNPDAVAWLLLRAASTGGHGVFQRTSFIQRVNTVGGIAPVEPGTTPGQRAHVPYTTEYLFYEG